MNLQENIIRIKEMMGLIKEDNVLLPITVSGSFQGEDNDQLHAFQSTKINGVRKVIGGMQTIVNAKLKEIYAAGHNPSISKVTATINTTTMTTSWEVTIDESTDGKAYLGLITAGSCCNSSFKTSAKNQESTMITWNSTPENHKKIVTLETTDDGKSSGDITIIGGPYRLKQYFYQYAYNNKPAHKNVESSKQTPADIEYEIPAGYTTQPADALYVKKN